MATKTISLELDAYDHLCRARRHERESFSSVVRRATFTTAISTGTSILEKLKSLPSLPDSVFAHWDRMEQEESVHPRVSPSAWDTPDVS
jgi:predicted CopG family antitoxin